MSETSAGTLVVAKPAPAKIDTSAVTEPVAKAGRQIYDQVAGGVQWYVEKWEDLVHEAKAARAQSVRLEGLTLASVLAGMDQAKVASNIPGRARLRLKSLRQQDQIAEQTAQALAALPGINQAMVNPLTGSVLVLYDKGLYSSLDALLQVVKSPKA